MEVQLHVALWLYLLDYFQVVITSEVSIGGGSTACSTLIVFIRLLSSGDHIGGVHWWRFNCSPLIVFIRLLSSGDQIGGVHWWRFNCM